MNNLPTIVGVVSCVGLSILFTNFIDKKYKETKSRQLLSYKPSVWTAFGIMGTFASILYSLWYCDINFEKVDQLVNNIVPAFVTSFIGVGMSIISAIRVKTVFAREDADTDKIYLEKTKDAPEVVLHNLFAETQSNNKILETSIEKICQVLDKQFSESKNAICKELSNQSSAIIKILRDVCSKLEDIKENETEANNKLESVVNNTSNLQKDMSGMFETSAKHIEDMSTNTIKHNGEITQKINTIVDNLTTFFNDVSENASKRIEELTNAHMKRVDELFIEYKKAYDSYNKAVKDSTADSIKEHKDALKGYHEGILKDLQEEFKKAKSDIGTCIQSMKDLNNQFTSHISETGENLHKELEKLPANVSESIQSAIANGFKELNKKYEGFENDSLAKVTKLQERILKDEIEKSSETYDKFNTNIGDVVEKMSTAVSKEITKTSEVFEKHNKDISEKIKSLSDAVLQEQTNTQEIVKQFAANIDTNKKLVDVLNKTLNNIDKVSDTISDTISKSEKHLKEVKDTYGSFHDTMQDLRDKCLELMNHKSVPVVNGIKKCPKCGHENEKDANYCEECSMPI